MHDNDNDNVISLDSRRNNKESKMSQVKPITYEFHFYPTVDEPSEGEIVQASGYIKFGPAFIAVLDGPDAEMNAVVFAVATPTVKYVKQIDGIGTVQGTLSL